MNVYKIKILHNNFPLCKAGLSRRLRLLCVSVRDVAPVLPRYLHPFIQYLAFKIQHYLYFLYPVSKSTLAVSSPPSRRAFRFPQISRVILSCVDFK